MIQRGKKSVDALAAIADMTGRQPAIVAPASLAPQALVVFKRTLSRAPLGWFCPEQADILGQYACAVATAERLRQMAMAENVELAEFMALSRLAQAEAGLALRYAIALRLTPHSRQDAKLAARRASGRRPGAAPWDVAGDDDGDSPA